MVLLRGSRVVVMSDLYCPECDHLLDDHGDYACNKIISRKRGGSISIDVCPCTRNKWGSWALYPHCAFCEHLKTVRLVGPEASILVDEGSGDYPLKVVVTNVKDGLGAMCSKGYWKNNIPTSMGELYSRVNQARSGFREEAIDCTDFHDMRPPLRDCVCEKCGMKNPQYYGEKRGTMICRRCYDERRGDRGYKKW